MSKRPSDPTLPPDGQLAANIAHFARALRRAGLPIGTDRIIGAIRAVAATGPANRDDFYHTLHASFVSRPEHRQVFAALFRLFWRDPQLHAQPGDLAGPNLVGPRRAQQAREAERRALEALLDGVRAGPHEAPDEPEPAELDASLTFSTAERLRAMDFEQMSAAETAEARRAIASLHLPIEPLASRRTRPAARGRLPDWPGTLRRALRQGGEIAALARRARRERLPNLVALCDISGSMSAYSRMILHFLHAAANAKGAGWAEVHAFTFGTRLTNITRHLRTRDVDAALAAAGRDARDWEGGTRIGASLHAFNRDWSRRVLASGGIVLLITDGLDRDDPARLAREIERLHLASRRLLWLNPLLRWDGFAPRAAGIRAILPHVDSFRACHSLASLEALVAALSRPEDTGERRRLMAKL